MRKKINVIVCILLAVCVLTLVACQERDSNGLIKLSTPKNLALNGSVLSWDEVDNAKEYFISVNGEKSPKGVTSSTCDLSSIVTGYGNFSIKVMAYGDGEKYGESDWSESLTYHKGNALDTPVVTINEKTASWTAVDRAVDYSVKVTDSKGKILDEVKSAELSYSFADKKVPVEGEETSDKDLYGDHGAYRITVIANPSAEDIEYSSSLAGSATYYNSTVLSVPKFTYMTGSTIRWEAVSDATNYTLRKTYEDGTYEDAAVSGTSYAYRAKFNLEKVGKYHFTIRANGDNQVYYTSQFSEKDDEYTVSKLAAVKDEDIKLQYNAREAKLSWKIAADSQATSFTLNLSALLPDGSVKLESNMTQKVISNKVQYVVADVYDFYKYDQDAVVKGEGKVLLYNMDGYAKVRYQGKDYFLKDKSDVDVKWDNYNPGASVNVICDMSDVDNLKFVNEGRTVNGPDGAILNQNTGEEEDVLGSDGKQLYYFDKVDGESDIDVVRKVVYEGDSAVYHSFELILDDIFIKENIEEGKTVYDYLISDNAYYGILYDVSVSADNDSKNFVASESAQTAGQYLSYKIPQKNEEGSYVVTNTGEYAYIIINSFINPNNEDKFSIEANINFNGYEIAQIENFYGKINGNKHTVSGIVVGNKTMTANGVVKNDEASVLKYSMFVNIDEKAVIDNVFYMGVGFVGYDKDELSENVTQIFVAPIAIDNHGTLRNMVVQSDAIKAEGADIAGMVINNYKLISLSSVYATLEGRNAGGVMLNNDSQGGVVNVGFYGKVTANLTETLAKGITDIGGAGFVVENKGNIDYCFAIGDVSVTAGGLDGVYAGGFVAKNRGIIMNSFSGEFTLNNIFNNLEANVNNAYAVGFVGYNISGKIASSYSTNKAAAGVYSGGFVGYNDSEVTSCYSTGGTKRTGENRGAFVGKNGGSIEKSICYSTDSWAEDDVVDVLKSSEQLDDILNTLYPDADGDMYMARDKGYRNPLIKFIVYTKENEISMRPSQTVSAEGIVFNNELEDVQATMHGDNSKKGNKVVIELKGETGLSRYIYGYVS
ncbi:MAG: hypothetical protein OSJ74_05805 [Clostridia bacterium]|nr:hypothetical protein [Clostridia bacterium]